MATQVVDKNAILNDVLAASREKARQHISRKKNVQNDQVVDNFNAPNKNNKTGVGMADNNALLTELEDKIAKIDERLGQIAGYKFVPPSIQEEKESLERQKSILAATKSRLAPEDTVPADASAEQGSVAPNSAPVAAPNQELKPESTITPEIKIEEKIEPAAKPAETKKEDKNLAEIFDVKPAPDVKPMPNIEVKDDLEAGLIGNDAVNTDIKKDDVKLESKTPLEDQVAGDAESAVKEAEDLVDAFKNTVKESDSPDAEYLAEVIGLFEKEVDKLVNRAKSIKMDDKVKARAIKGRLALYIKSIKQEFEFSELLSADLDKKIKAITKTD